MGAKKIKKLKNALIITLCILSVGAKGQKIKVMAYNVEYGRNVTTEEMSSFLMLQQADVICFNEVPEKGWTKKVGGFLDMKYSYEGDIASANHKENYKDKTKSYYGKYKSILSRYPLENTHEVLLEGVRWSPASAVVATIKVSKKKSLLVFSLHIPTGIDNPKKSKAYHLAQLLKTNYSNIDKIVLAGDFNDRYDSEPLKFLYNQGFINPYSTLNIDLSQATTLSRENINGKVIDHILYKGIKVKRAGIIEEKTLSDHKPVWAVFKLR